MDVDACSNTVNEVRYLEHVQCKISLRFFPRGNLRIILTSPMGTKSVLLFERPRDVISSNFDDWPFLSVHFWGEKAEGRWQLQIINAGTRHVTQVGLLKKWQLIFYGKKIFYFSGIDIVNKFYNRYIPQFLVIKIWIPLSLKKESLTVLSLYYDIIHIRKHNY